ncbi:MAG: flagellar FlbD family protein [Anaerolineae bacterium]
MIEVTRLDGSTIYVNADHIRTVEANPDTVIAFADGKRLVVAESPSEVAGKVIWYRAQIHRFGVFATEVN